MTMNWWRLAALCLISAILGAGVMIAAQAVFGVGGDRARTEKIVHDYVLDNPELIPDAMDKLRAKQAAQIVDANEPAIVQPFGSAWQGAKNPKVNVVVYMDYACGYCRASLPEIAKLVKNEPDVRVVYRELPILSTESQTAALWSLAAADQGKFQTFHDTLFHADQLSDNTIHAAAQKAGLDMQRAAQFVASQAAQQQIAQNLSLASQLGMNGTPSWVIGDQVTSGAMPYEQLKQLIAQARKDA